MAKVTGVAEGCPTRIRTLHDDKQILQNGRGGTLSTAQRNSVSLANSSHHWHALARGTAGQQQDADPAAC